MVVRRVEGGEKTKQTKTKTKTKKQMKKPQVRKQKAAVLVEREARAGRRGIHRHIQIKPNRTKQYTNEKKSKAKTER